jgi:hypothetical protein
MIATPTEGRFASPFRLPWFAVEKIGPYDNDVRATWPIQEVEGAAEHPEWLRPISQVH